MKKLLLILMLLSLSSNAMAEEYNLREKIGQMIIVGFRGDKVNSNSKIIRDIEAGRVGGVIYFDYDVVNKSPDRNIKSREQVQNLSYNLQKSSGKIPLFIAVDQEGGKVQRLKPKHGFLKQMSAQELGKTDDINLTNWEAVKSGKLLNLVGINVNFAPVVDVNINPHNPAIGKLGRSYSKNPETVYRHAKATVDGYKSKGIITSLKHFPGHGSAFNDSHLGLTDITNTWNKTELIPYKKLIAENKVDMIMMGHLFNKDMDDTHPASISKKTSDFLRNDLGYNGVLISDDMQMNAIKDFYTIREQVDYFLYSSMDIILYGNNLNYDEDIAEKVFDLIYKKAMHDPLVEERINQSFKRIMRLKDRL